MAKKETKEKSYNIKVPVYTTTMLDQTVGLFENVSPVGGIKIAHI